MIPNPFLQFSLRIVAAPLEIVHFAADPSEPSHGVRLHAPSCSYTGAPADF